MATTSHLTKTATTRGFILPGDIVDNTTVTDIQHNNNGITHLTRLRIGGTWGEWLPSDWHISVYR
jgi:Flp pilus assembly protein CpaB